MRQFKHPNTSEGWKCPICRTAYDAPVVLMGIPGTDDGHNLQGKQVHTTCYCVMANMTEEQLVIEPLTTEVTTEEPRKSPRKSRSRKCNQKQ